jgi:uncharacterized membrane protein
MSKPAQILCLVIALSFPVIAVGGVILDPDPLWVLGWIVLAFLAAMALVLVVVIDSALRSGRDIFRGEDDRER